MLKKLLLVWSVCVVCGQSISARQLVVKTNEYNIIYLSYNKVELVNQAQGKGWGLSGEGYKVIRKGGKVDFAWSNGISTVRKGDMEWVYQFNFGQLNFACRQDRDTLFMTMKLKNTSMSDTLCGVNLIPLKLGFPQRPAGFYPGVPYYHYSYDGPNIISADFGNGKLALSDEDNKAVFTGLIDVEATKDFVLYKVWNSNIPFNGMNTAGLPSLEMRLAPGKSVTYRLALRFYPSGTPELKMAAPVMAAYKKANRVKYSWPDRRMIGALVLSSVTKQDEKINPRGWFYQEKINTITKAGRTDLRNKLMTYAKQSIQILKDMNAQGMITWDIEGQQFPHPISYVGSPDKVKSVAPEMDAMVDEYFRLFRNAGFKTGVAIRPQEFTLNNDGSWAVQKDVRDPAAVLIRKIKYAYQRWGCTLFYIDSNVDSTTALMPADVFKRVQEAVPYALLIPEHQNTRYFEYTAPYEDMRFGMNHMDESQWAAYPNGFLVINTAEGLFDAQGNRRVTDEMLRQSLLEGNILMFRAWYYDPANPILKKIYQATKGNK